MRKKKVLLSLLLAVVIAPTGLAIYNRLNSMVSAGDTKTVELQNGQTFDLTAQSVRKDINGKSQTMLAYNWSIPGPTLKVKQGSKVTINFKNKLDQDTAVHFHGIRTDNSSDGVVGVTQAAIKPGDSYTYKLNFPDPGAYWYHPHVREDSTQPLGLYGSIIVEPEQPDYWDPVNKEVPLMIGDVLTDDKGKISAFDGNEVTYTLMGRFGNTMLVNGSTNYEAQAVAGEVVRYYVTNVASSRPFKLAIPGAKLKLVGADGGAFERATLVDSVTISPSERAALDVWYEKPGTYKLQNQTPTKMYDLATIIVASGNPRASYLNQFTTLKANASVINSISPFRSAITKPADKSLTLSLSMNSGSSMEGMDMGSGMPGMDMGGMNMPADTDAIEWEDAMPSMSKPSTSKSLTWKLIDQQTNAFNDKINWQFKRGQQVKIKLYNDPNSAHAMQHPIHIHGQRFLVTSVNGKTTDNLVWKDTVQVGKGETVELLVDMSNPGTWLIHCHIPEHMESGMQLKYTVQ